VTLSWICQRKYDYPEVCLEFPHPASALQICTASPGGDYRFLKVRSFEHLVGFGIPEHIPSTLNAHHSDIALNVAPKMAPTKNFHNTAYPTIDSTRTELSAKGKTVVITGGGTVIGRETAKYFVKAGASRIAILDRKEQPLLETKATIKAEVLNVETTAIATDITKESQIKDAFEKVAAGSKIHVVCSNAAIHGAIGPIATLSADQWRDFPSINCM
jgi:hypothetical protein